MRDFINKFANNKSLSYNGIIQDFLMDGKRYRLLTRGDFDGIVCAVLLKDLNLIENVEFIHPKDIQDNRFQVTGQDIIANLPYHPDAHLVFEHHASEMIRNTFEGKKNIIIDTKAESTAQMLYHYYGGLKTFKNISPQLIKAVSKADSAQFTKKEVLKPAGWDLLNFIMDPRTGLGRFKSFSVSNQQYLLNLIDYIRYYPLHRILEQIDVLERCELFFEHQVIFQRQIRKCARLHRKRTVLLDYRKEIIIYAGNRFIVYALYPTANLSIHILNSPDRSRTVFAIGKSIFNKTSKINVGELCLRYGGGGHENAGTCQVPAGDAEKVLDEILAIVDSSQK
jgi:nanoRNase/pAp phosphatase (c-di-AMP/oligoRNAs hydrolase)